MTSKEQEDFCNKAQDKERNFFLSYKSYHPHITSFEFTPLSSRLDVIFVSAGTEYCAEIKIREDNSNEYFIKYGPYLEEKKLIGMIEENVAERPMMYFSFANNGCAVYLLSPNLKDYPWNEEILPKSNWDKTRVKKIATKLFNPSDKFAYNLKQK